MGFNNIPDSVKQYLPGDFLATNPNIPVNTNFLTNNKFIFMLDRCPTIAYFCQRANVPSVSLGISIQNTPTAIQIQRPGTNVTLEEFQIGFAIDEDLLNWREIHNWIKAITYYGNNCQILKEEQQTANASLLILNSSYRPFLKVRFYDIFPTFLSGIDFDSTLPDTDNIIASVNFAYSYFDIETI